MPSKTASSGQDLKQTMHLPASKTHSSFQSESAPKRPISSKNNHKKQNQLLLSHTSLKRLQTRPQIENSTAWLKRNKWKIAKSLQFERKRNENPAKDQPKSTYIKRSFHYAFDQRS